MDPNNDFLIEIDLCMSVALLVSAQIPDMKASSTHWANRVSLFQIWRLLNRPGFTGDLELNSP